MNLYFTKTTSGAAFLPRYVAESIPFSSKNLVKVMNQFSVDTESAVADGMRQTLKLCESPDLDGEIKLCATSLETMVDFSTSMLGKKVQLMSTEIDKEEIPKQHYTVSQGVTKMGGQTYAYAVFYCHGTHSQTRTKYL
ncbi:hypothetical protein IFM89_039283 [Coptis chinensis]|uniref:BURP domain-containing protein n=1 Tax=Coptis chinensis TaxID=261450 RepID=A0A835IHN9_9MAGN|nr:hypothetical protein IFM89_039283 [Coptis chinensis]